MAYPTEHGITLRTLILPHQNPILNRPMSPEDDRFPETGKEESKQCEAIVYVPEQLRYTGYGPSGFERTIHRQCRRKAVHDGLCHQHDKSPNTARKIL